MQPTSIDLSDFDPPCIPCSVEIEGLHTDGPLMHRIHHAPHPVVLSPLVRQFRALPPLSHPRLHAQALGTVLKMLTLTPAAARPESEEAQRVLSFFLSTLVRKAFSVLSVSVSALEPALGWQETTNHQSLLSF